MTDELTYEYDLFISYNREDEEWAKRLAERVEQEEWQSRRLRVFFAPWDILPGESIDDRLERALEKSRKVGLIMTPSSVASEWVKEERHATHHADVARRERRLIPIYRRDCEIPTFLKTIKFVDFRDDAKFEEGASLLVAVIKGERPQRGGQHDEPKQDALPPSSIPRPPVFGFVARRDAQGRDIVERLREELAPGRGRLVTLSGPGGIGKSTLAAQAARELRETYGRRVVWSSADGRADFSFPSLLDDIATQLGRAELRTLAPAEKEEQVRALVADALVVLDNYETVVASEQKRIEAWFARTQCSALFTSRTRVEGTVFIPISAMSREEASEFLEKLTEQTQDPRMFTREVRERVYETAEANPFVMQWVVGQIDLAQEPEAVLEELKHGGGDAARRVFDRSFELPLLGDDGRDALLALALFAPSARVEALASVAGFDDAGRASEAVKNLRRLWLIKGVDGNRRLAVEGLTRTLAAARLSRDPRADEFRRRFVAYFLRYAEERKASTPENYDMLEGEKDNLLSAAEAAFAAEDWGSIITMAYALVPGRMLYVRGYWHEALRLSERALQGAHRLQDEDGIASLSLNLGIMYLSRGEISKARKLYGESLESMKKLGNQPGVARALHELGRLAQNQGELEEALRLYNESLEIAKRLGDQVGVAISLNQLSTLAQEQGELEEARRIIGESLEIEKRLGNQEGVARTLHNLAMLAQGQGELEEARRLFDESLEINKKLGDQNGVAMSLHQLGRLAGKEGDKVEAAQLFREALSIFERLGSPNAEIARRSLARMEGEDS
jgi:tetratricopeptide (TPR) repeat protein